MIVVFDSGIWISAMQFRGMPFEAVVKAIGEDWFAMCGYIEAEVVRILTEKFGWARERVIGDLSLYCRDAVRVELQGTISGVCRDPNDEPILECAVRAGASCLVTGDNDLLIVGSHQNIRILTARDYLGLSARKGIFVTVRSQIDSRGRLEIPPQLRKLFDDHELSRPAIPDFFFFENPGARVRHENGV